MSDLDLTIFCFLPETNILEGPELKKKKSTPYQGEKFYQLNSVAQQQLL